MDLNVKVIEGVSRFPSLYDNKANLEERSQDWLKLSEQLKLHEIHLKLRWHFLLREYQRDVNFEYAKYMQFITPKNESQTNVENWPEFVITEDDLKRSKQEQEEYIFVELEDEEQKVNKSKQDPLKEEAISIKLKDTRNEEFTNKEENKCDTDKVIKEIVPESNSNSKPNSVNSPPPGVPFKVDEKIAAIDVNKTNDECSIKPKQLVEERPKQSTNERCEDIIFGELVSAELKRMDENRKKNIKKEIMNILLS